MSLAKFVYIVLKSQFLERIPYIQHDFSGQTIIVTGSNTGIGFEAARQLVHHGASKVILAVRSTSKGEVAARKLLESTKATRSQVEVWQLDLSDYNSIKAFATRVEQLPRLDAVLQNAGMLTQKWTTIDGDEAQIRVNVLGALLLGLHVLPKLRETGKKFGVRTRLSYVGSDAHYVAQFKEANNAGSLFAALNDEKKSNMMDRYMTSKLLLFYGVREIAARNPITPDSNVVINVMTPGACKSDIFRDSSGISGMIGVLIHDLLGRSTEVGGRTLIDAIKPDINTDSHGAFLMNRKIFPNGPSVDSVKGQELEKRFNKELCERLESIVPGVTKALN